MQLSRGKPYIFSVTVYGYCWVRSLLLLSVSVNILLVVLAEEWGVLTKQRTNIIFLIKLRKSFSHSFIQGIPSQRSVWVMWNSFSFEFIYGCFCQEIQTNLQLKWLLIAFCTLSHWSRFVCLLEWEIRLKAGEIKGREGALDHYPLIHPMKRLLTLDRRWLYLWSHSTGRYQCHIKSLCQYDQVKNGKIDIVCMCVCHFMIKLSYTLAFLLDFCALKYNHNKNLWN